MNWPCDLCYQPVKVALALLLASVGLLSGCERSPSGNPANASPPPATLTILTPHSESIRRTFEEGFWNWRIASGRGPIQINWIYRGTPQCVQYVLTYNDARAQDDRVARPDVLFGGGIPDHARLAAEGYSRPVDLGDAARRLPAEVNGLPTRDERGRWYATGLSSFGILYNAAACDARGIAPPGTWADLADPRFFGWVSMADPARSGSHLVCLQMILEHEGWDRGWGTLLRILGNCRALAGRSGEAIDQVRSGVMLATFAVNFDGLAAAAESDGALRYVDPPGATTATPDVLSVLATAANTETAVEFARYVMSEEGQALWVVQREKRAPYGETLYHYPIDPAIYERYRDGLSAPGEPGGAGFALRLKPQKAEWQNEVLPLLVRAAAGPQHVALQKAWKALIDGGMPGERVAGLLAPPLDEAAAEKLLAELRQAPKSANSIQERVAAAMAEVYRRSGAAAP